MIKSKPKKKDGTLATKPLIPRHVAFCDEYLANGFNATAAYRVVYSPKNDSHCHIRSAELVAKSSIQSHLAIKQAEIARKASITHQDIINDLITIRDVCMARRDTVDRDGNVVGSQLCDAPAALKAIDMIGKHIGMWQDKSDASTIGTALAAAIQALSLPEPAPRPTTVNVVAVNVGESP